jgi:hypothetical protein
MSREGRQPNAQGPVWFGVGGAHDDTARPQRLQIKPRMGDWWCGSSSEAPASQAQGPKFKHQPYQK